MPPILGLLGTLLGTTTTGATLAATAGLAGAGLGIGEGIDNLVKGNPSTPNTPTQSTLPTVPAQTGPTPSQISASQQVGSNVTSATSGFVSPGYTQAIMELLNGPSGAQQASNNIYGTPG